MTCYQDIAGTMAEIRWSDDVQEICYRVSRGGDGTSSDNSGDYTVYAESGTLDAGGTTVHWRGPGRQDPGGGLDREQPDLLHPCR